MRATGLRLNSPLAEQAQSPPLDPDEMGLIDAACIVYRVAGRPYRSLAEQVWGAQGVRDRLASRRENGMRPPGPRACFGPVSGGISRRWIGELLNPPSTASRKRSPVTKDRRR